MALRQNSSKVVMLAVVSEVHSIREGSLEALMGKIGWYSSV